MTGAHQSSHGFPTILGRRTALSLLFLGFLGWVWVASAGEAPRDFLNEPQAGSWLAATEDLSVWWCEGGWKIGRNHPLPAKPAGDPEPVRVSAARGEYEPAQIILQPKNNTQLVSLDLQANQTGTGDPKLPQGISAEFSEVAYVEVTHPTDGTSLPGWYPDPLPPLHLPLGLKSSENQPLWLTFHVASEAKAGDHLLRLQLRTSSSTVAVPIVVHVYDFALPETSHLKSALGLGTGEINRYQNLKRREDQELVFAKYLRNFAEHRISPYSFYDYSPIDIRFAGEGTNKQAMIDFTRFDETATKWLDQWHFSTFQLPLRGMGGGTFFSRRLGDLEGFQEGTPEHARLFHDYLSQVEQHLRQHGWLDKAFTYWFDEPEPKDYEFVAAGMKRLKEAAPGLRRMLTVQPAAQLASDVEIWCVPTFQCTGDRIRERQTAGQEIWWYICCAPKAPYITEFIDHPGSELRLWPWQSWQNGVTGILIWATTYWSSSAAFPPPQRQDPWTDPMSYQAGYGEKPGEKKYWGNGDGRFLYPPRPSSSSDTAPCLEAPVNSVRWENLRDGMEDYEYFWLLRQAIDQATAHSQAEAVKEARALLKVPEEISQDLTHFTTNPRLLLQHRDRIAKAIEAENARLAFRR